MKQYYYILLDSILAGLLLLAAGCSAIEEPDAGKTENGSHKDFVSMKIRNSPRKAVGGVLLVRFNEEAEARITQGIAVRSGRTPATRSGVTSVDNVFSEIRTTRFEKAFPATERTEKRLKAMGLDKWYVVRFDKDTPVDEAAVSLASLADVEEVQYNTELAMAGSFKTSAYRSADYRSAAYHSTDYRSADDRSADYRSADNHSADNRSAAGSGTQAVFNDPYLVDQWHYINTGDPSVCPGVKAGADINVKDAWKLCGGVPEVIVAVVDEGVQYNHPDLADNMWTNVRELDGRLYSDDDGNHYIDDIHGYNFVRDTIVTWNREGDVGHGTHVAGTIAAVNNNGIGVCGIAGGNGYDPGVRIMSCQIFDGATGGDALSSARAFIYAADNGASILQCSFSLAPAFYVNDTEFESLGQLQWTALKYFFYYGGLPAGNGEVDEDGNERTLGGVAIFASGNDSFHAACYPGAHSECICVTAIGPDYLPTSYTNYGPGCNIAAPGGEPLLGNNAKVLSTAPKEMTPDGSEYMMAQGTSMACPHVAGVAALGMSYAHKLGKKFTRDKFTSMLLTSVNSLEYFMDGSSEFINLEDYRRKMGSGSVDAWKLLMQIEGTPCLVAEMGRESRLNLKPYFGGSSDSVVFTEVTMTATDKRALGVTKNPVMNSGDLVINCGKYGSGKLTVTAIVGRGSNEDLMAGGTTIKKEISIVSRAVLSENGGWL